MGKISFEKIFSEANAPIKLGNRPLIIPVKQNNKQTKTVKIFNNKNMWMFYIPQFIDILASSKRIYIGVIQDKIQDKIFMSPKEGLLEERYMPDIVVYPRPVYLNRARGTVMSSINKKIRIKYPGATHLVFTSVEPEIFEVEICHVAHVIKCD